jgi:hypothetical protein
MSGVKIQLSREERELVANPAIILTKNKIIEAVMELFGQLSHEEIAFTNEFRDRLPDQLYVHPPKISRGENYLRLPWVMLDFPRDFKTENALAVRHFFWWGNFFSSTLQVSGLFKEKLVKKIDQWPEDTYICVHASPWEHHLELDNYIPVSSLSRTEINYLLEQKDFIKLALVIPLGKWDDVPAFLLNCFRSWMNLVQS